MNKKVKTVIISLVSLVLVVAIVIGIVWLAGRSTDPVKVVPVNYHTLGYFDNTTYYSGYVKADNLQSIRVSDTQTVTEILVSEGQEVKAGDPLVRYDTTLSDIQLERKKIAVQQAELNLQQAQKQLKEINAMKPYTPPPATTAPTEAPTEPLEPIEELPYRITGDGSRENPLRYLWSDELTYDEAFIRGRFNEGQTEVWLAFEVREENALKGETLALWGLHVTRNSETDALTYAFFTPEELPDEEPDVPTPPDNPWVDDSSGHTAAEIAQMRKEKQKEIRDLDLAWRVAQVEYEKMQEESAGNTVFATVDGVVMQLVDEETARLNGVPLMLVSGGGHFYVTISVGEYDRERIIGKEVTIQSWMNGSFATTATVESVSDMPTSGNSFGGGNPSVTMYEALVAVGPDAALSEGDYVDVVLNDDAGPAGSLYLENMYIREEDGRAYVYVRGGDGLLEKRYVTTGGILYGYTAIYSGLTADDWIAFPYGKEVREGAQTVEDADNAYSFY